MTSRVRIRFQIDFQLVTACRKQLNVIGTALDSIYILSMNIQYGLLVY